MNDAKSSPTLEYLAFYLVIIVAIDIFGLFGQVWMFYLGLGLLLFSFWAFVLFTDDAKKETEKAAFAFFAWQIPMFIVVGVLIQVQVDPFVTLWTITWPALVLLGVWLLTSRFVLFREARGRFEFYVVGSISLGALAHVFGLLEPVSSSSSSLAHFLAGISTPVTVGFYSLALFVFVARIVHTTTRVTSLGPFVPLDPPLPESNRDSFFGVLIFQFQMILNVFLLTIDFVWRGVVLRVLEYVSKWFAESVTQTIQATLSVAKEIVRFFRLVMAQIPSHLLTVYTLWFFASNLRYYLYESGSLFIFIGVTLIAFVVLSVHFFITIPLLLGSRGITEFRDVLVSIREHLELISPHVLFIFAASAWSLIGLTYLFGIGRFTIGFFTLSSTALLFVGLTVAWSKRNRKGPPGQANGVSD